MVAEDVETQKQIKRNGPASRSKTYFILELLDRLEKGKISTFQKGTSRHLEI